MIYRVLRIVIWQSLAAALLMMVVGCKSSTPRPRAKPAMPAKSHAKTSALTPSAAAPSVSSTKDDAHKTKVELHHEALAKADEAMRAGNIELAYDEWDRAEFIRASNQNPSREFPTAADAEAYGRNVLMGDQAMEMHNYDEAASSYVEAQFIRSSGDLETKCRRARAMSLVHAAGLEFDRGNTQKAEQYLNAAEWHYATAEAAILLDQIKQSPRKAPAANQP